MRRIAARTCVGSLRLRHASTPGANSGGSNLPCGKNTPPNMSPEEAMFNAQVDALNSYALGGGDIIGFLKEDQKEKVKQALVEAAKKGEKLDYITVDLHADEKNPLISPETMSLLKKGPVAAQPAPDVPKFKSMSELKQMASPPPPPPPSNKASPPEPPKQPKEDKFETIVPEAGVKEAEPNQDEVWSRIQLKLKERRVDAEVAQEQKRPSIVDFYKAEAVVKEQDRYHWRLGKLLFDDFDMRLQYYALHALGLALNKAKWVHIDVSAQKGAGKTGANMRQAFWLESLNSIIDTGDMISGQFVDGHPVLRPIAAMHKHHKFTKHFLRSFVQARLKIPFTQPGNMNQLGAYYEKSYSHFYLIYLEMLGIKNNSVAEHIASHFGKAMGLTQQSVLLWRHYARKGIVMLPADLCAANNVSHALVTNLELATRDAGIRRILHEIMNVVLHELTMAQDMIHDLPTQAWPLLFETVLPNYYLGFLLENDFDVTRYWSEDFVYTPGFYYYLLKKVSHWSRHHDFVAFLDQRVDLFKW